VRGRLIIVVVFLRGVVRRGFLVFWGGLVGGIGRWWRGIFVV
jgi:hypothetical protein